MNLSKTLRFAFLPIAAILAQSAYAQLPAHARALVPGPVAEGVMRSHAWILDKTPFAAHGPGQTSCVTGCYYLPADIISAYAVSSITNGNGGAGITIGIVDAYYNPQTAADLAANPALASCPLSASGSPLTACLTIVDQTGCNTAACLRKIQSNAGWAGETDLDVQIVHGIAPNAKIYLVACNSSSSIDLGKGDQTAEANANIVTNSWGGNENNIETLGDIFLSGSTVPVLFSAGDTGSVVEYPCVSKYAVCVGGTSLLETAEGQRYAEGAWGTEPYSGNALPTGGGGGCSAHVQAPSFQSGFNTCGTYRGVPDISALADEYTGFLVSLGTFAAGGPAGEYIIGGTSLASPLTAAVFANIDAARVFNGKSVLGSNLNSLIYKAADPVNYSSRFFDVTTGTSGTFAATTGWDEATGLGVILGPALSTYLLTQ